MIPDLPAPATPIVERLAKPIGRVWQQWLQAFRRVVAGRLIPTAVKTAAYSASMWELVLVDPTLAGFAVTLPPNADDGARVGYKNVSTSANAVTVAGADVTVNGAASHSQTSVCSDLHTEYIYCKDREEWIT